MSDDTKHSPEPWGAGEGNVYGSAGAGMLIAPCGDAPSSTADARRIVAAVNACSGLPTEDAGALAVNPVLHTCQRWTAHVAHLAAGIRALAEAWSHGDTMETRARFAKPSEYAAALLAEWDRLSLSFEEKP